MLKYMYATFGLDFLIDQKYQYMSLEYFRGGICRRIQPARNPGGLFVNK